MNIDWTPYMLMLIPKVLCGKRLEFEGIRTAKPFEIVHYWGLDCRQYQKDLAEGKIKKEEYQEVTRQTVKL